MGPSRTRHHCCSRQDKGARCLPGVALLPRLDPGGPPEADWLTAGDLLENFPLCKPFSGLPLPCLLLAFSLETIFPKVTGSSERAKANELSRGSFLLVSASCWIWLRQVLHTCVET